MHSTRLSKTFLHLVGIVGLVLGLLAAPGMLARAQDGPTPGSALSQENAAGYALAHLEREQGVIPEWVGAQLEAPVIHYDLAGQRAAYVFPLVRDGLDVGYITISAVAMENPVLEFGRGTAYARTERLAVEATVNGLGVPVDLEHPLYLGALAYFYRIDAPGDARLIEMGTGRLVTLKDMTAMAPREQTQQNLLEQANPQVLPAVVSSRLLVGPDYDWYHGCGPTAVGNLMGYYADRGFPNLVAGGSKGNYRAAIDELAALMGTVLPEGWTWLPINDDIMRYTANHGYSFSSTETYDPPFTALVGQIDQHHPVGVLVNGHELYGNHFITAFGYQYDPANASQNYIMVHDTWNSTDVDAWMQFGAGYEKIWFDTAIPAAGTFTPDLTPPSSTMKALDAYQVSGSFPISWSGTDTGFGIASYDIQYRDGAGGDWQIYLENVSATSATFYLGQPGHTYYFQSRARDIDGNREAWAGGNGDTSTTVALYVGYGQALTNREKPVMGATITANPAQGTARSDHTGLFALPFGTGGTYDISVDGPDATYGDLPALHDMDPAAWQEPILYLLPADNVLLNGQFESGALSSWTTGGDAAPALVSTAHTGSGAARLGSTSAITGNSWIRQSHSVPVGLTRPTLSFLYHWDTNNPLDGQFVVTISAGTTTQTVDLAAGGSGWVHRWVDVSQFQGQTVTVQFQMNQILGNPNQTALVDEVSLGSELQGSWGVYLPSVQR